MSSISVNATNRVTITNTGTTSRALQCTSAMKRLDTC